MATVTCKPVHNLKLSTQSVAALKRIGDQLDNAQTGSLLLMSGIFHSIFTRAAGAWQVGINIYSSDWDGLAKASGDWPMAVKHIIAKDAHMMAISTSGQEALFWEELAKCLGD